MVVLEVACDESGYEGEKLVGGVTDVFAHASVAMDTAEAAQCIAETRRRIRSPAMEYKAGHLLREKHRSVLEWLLSPEGPLTGRAHVFLVDKTWFLVRTTAEVLLADADPGVATALYRDGPRGFGPTWAAVLEAANDLIRIKEQPEQPDVVDAFFDQLDQPRVALASLDDAVERLRGCRPAARQYREQLRTAGVTIPVLDPLFPAIRRAVAYWGGAAPVRVVHDQQNALSPARIRQLVAALDDTSGGLVLADSFFDPRVQVADFLAGVARKIASDQLGGHGDVVLVDLLRPFVDALSTWDGEVLRASPAPPAAAADR